MGFGVYSCMSGAKSRATELEILANNIANVQTVGYKEMGIAFNSLVNQNVNAHSDEFPSTKLQSLDKIDFHDGSIMKTDNPLDVALQGDGFFEVQTKDGLRYTRNGHFSIDKTGRLITQNGDSVMGTNGAITVPQDTPLNISNTGNLSAGEEDLGVLKVVTFDEKNKLKLAGNNFYSADGLTPKPSESFTTAQGFLESSNVNLVRNLTRIVEVSRSYETCQKSMSRQFEVTQQLNAIAKS